MAALEPFAVSLEAFGDLQFFLRRHQRERPFLRILNEKTSVKDVIESCGVLHPEVDLILVGERPVRFSHQLEMETALSIYPVATPMDFFPLTGCKRGTSARSSPMVTSENSRAIFAC